MARTNGHGCPHNCARCRALESGHAGPYSPKDMIRLGLVVFPDDGPPETSAELSEARLRVELCEIAYEQAQRDMALVHAAKDKRAAPVAMNQYGEFVSTGDDGPGSRDLDGAEDEAMGRLRAVGERLVEARRGERAIASSESAERSRLSLVESSAELERLRAERAEASRSGTRVLERLRKGGR